MKKHEWTEKGKELLKKISSFLSQLNLSSINNFLLLLINIIALWTYVSISPVIADYQGNGHFRTALLAVISLLFTISALKLLFHFKSGLKRLLSRSCQICERGKRLPGKKKALFTVLSLSCAAAVLSIHHFACRVTYYRSVTEIYGLPAGIGECLDRRQREASANYWEIREYLFRRVIDLNYRNGYDNLSLLEQYSSLYSMPFFQPASHLRYTYTVNRSELRAMGEEAYVEAEKNKFRIADRITYYSDDGRTLISMKRNHGGRYDIDDYSAKDTPQLINSTIFKVPEDSDLEKNLIAHLDITYDLRGLPKTRMISPGIYNLYGVCGESYTYDERGCVTSLCYLDQEGKPAANKLGIMLVNFSYDDAGNLHSVKYYSDKEGLDKIEGFHGVYCEKLEYDKDCNIRLRLQLDRNETGRYDANGVSVYEYTYESGRLSGEFFRDINQAEIRDKTFHSTALRFSKSVKGRLPEISIYFDYDYRSSGHTLPDSQGRPAYLPAFHEIKGPQGEDLQQVNLTSLLLLNQEDSANPTEKNETPLPASEDSEQQNPFRQAKAYSCIRYHLNGQNQLLSETYFDKSGQKVRNENGYVCLRYEYDSHGNLYRKSYRDEKDHPCEIAAGYAEAEYQYEKSAPFRLLRTRYLDISGKPAIHLKYGYSSVLYRYSTEGSQENVVVSYYDQEEQPVRLLDESYSSVSKLYNEYGRLIKTAYYGTDGAPAYQKQTGVSEVQQEYTEDGNVSRVSYRDTSGDIMCRRDSGYASFINEYDRGLLISRSYYDTEAKPVPTKEGEYAEIRYSYQSGRRTGIAYYDIHGQKTFLKDKGYASVQYTYGKQGLISEYRYYGKNDELTLRWDTGYAICRCAYDSYGNTEREEYLDTNQAPVLRREEGYAAYKDTFEDGKWVEGEYYDEAGQLINRRDTGYAIIKNTYNTNGQRTRQSYYGADRKPVLKRESYFASMEMVYDGRGNVTEYHYYGTEGEPVLRADTGYSVVKYTYDSFGNTLTGSYWKTDGKTPAAHKDYGYTSFEDQYTGKDWTGSRYLDSKGKLTARRDTGCAIISNRYDNYGNRIEEAYYGSDQKPTEHRDVTACRVQIDFDGRGNPVEYRYYGKDGALEARADNGCSVYRYLYDNRGYIAERHYYDAQKNPCVRTDTGYALVKYQHDEYGNIIRCAYYDLEQQPAVDRTTGFASYQDFYENNRWTEGRYYGKDGQLAARSDKGYAIIKNAYDAKGQRTAENYYGPDEQPVFALNNDCARMEMNYYDCGLVKERRYCGKNGELANRYDTGYASVTYQYDDAGHLTEQKYFDDQGKPTAWKERGYASFTETYDKDNWIEGRYFDTEGKLVTWAKEGFAVIRNEYRDNQRVSQSFYGADEKPVMHRNLKCFVLKMSYDEKGQVCRYDYCDADGNPQARIDTGYAAAVYEYDDWGNAAKGFFYGADGAPILSREPGHAAFTDVYEGGRLLESRSYDEQMQLTSRSDHGWSIKRNIYNDRKQLIRIVYQDSEGHPVLNKKEGCSMIEYSYDKRGNLEKAVYCGKDGRPILRTDSGCAVVRYKRDDCGRVTEKSYYDRSDKPTVTKEGGYFACVSVYTGNNLTELSYLGTDGNLIARRDTGYAVLDKTYNEHHLCSQDAYFDQQGRRTLHTKNGYAYVNRSYDSKGNNRQNTYYGTDTASILRNGYSIETFTYDDAGRITTAAYWDAGKNPVTLQKEGYSYYRIIYKNGLRIETRYYDTAGELVTRPDTGYALYQNKYDSAGRLVEQSFQDAGEKPVVSKTDHCAYMILLYDSVEQSETYWYYGINLNLQNRDDTGYAIRRDYYDHRGNLVSQWFWDADKAPALYKGGGYSHLENKYENGLLTETSYWGPEGAVNREDTGYSKVIYTYNDNWQAYKEDYLDKDGVPALHKKRGCTGYEIQFDERGHVTEYRYYGADGLPVNRSDTGYAVAIYEYDIYGNITKSTFLDAQGNPVDRS